MNDRAPSRLENKRNEREQSCEHFERNNNTVMVMLCSATITYCQLCILTRFYLYIGSIPRRKYEQWSNYLKHENITIKRGQRGLRGRGGGGTALSAYVFY